MECTGSIGYKGLKQVRRYKDSIEHALGEKNGQFKWKFDADTNDFVLIDPLDEPLYSYEMPFLTKFL